MKSKKLVSVENLHVIILILHNLAFEFFHTVSVENLHVIILIPPVLLFRLCIMRSFSRKPACYNTDTMEDRDFDFHKIVSVENLHVIILIHL